MFPRLNSDKLLLFCFLLLIIFKFKQIAFGIINCFFKYTYIFKIFLGSRLLFTNASQRICDINRTLQQQVSFKCHCICYNRILFVTFALHFRKKQVTKYQMYKCEHIAMRLELQSMVPSKYLPGTNGFLILTFSDYQFF